jgi:hypothetical protein
MKAVKRTAHRFGMISAAVCLVIGAILSWAGPASATTQLCSISGGFAYLGGQCLPGPGTYHFSSQDYPFGYLVNNTGYRVWFHQKSDGTGWADCFSHGMAYGLAQGRDANAQQVEVTTNSASCGSSGNQGSALCKTYAPMAFLILPGICYYAGANTNGPGDSSSILTNATGFRVWFHQMASGGGWADCFSNNSVYSLTGRDMNPGNVYVSTNSAPC